ncbi:MAG: AAA family ATPase [Pseudomonadota bacterium]
MIHLNQVDIHSDAFPVTDAYPFNLNILQTTKSLDFTDTITFCIGENGTGKSTFLKALAQRCGIHIWQNEFNMRIEKNPHEEHLYQFLSPAWKNGPVKGSFFSSQIFSCFAQNLEEWAVNDINMLDFFGGKSLITQSHGQSLMSYFKSRYTIEGLYFLDEPETALSPSSLIQLLNLLNKFNQTGRAQFIIATHSPILLACPDARIYTFNTEKIEPIAYKDTDYYKIYKQFMAHPNQFMT